MEQGLIREQRSPSMRRGQSRGGLRWRAGCAIACVVATLGVGASISAGAGAKGAVLNCAGYDGPPATWADFTQVRASGVTCQLAERLIRALYGQDYAASHLLTVGASANHVVFAKDVRYVSGGYELRLVGQPPKYAGDLVSTRVLIGAGLPDPNGHQVP
jgi:hypothetical protein